MKYLSVCVALFWVCFSAINIILGHFFFFLNFLSWVLKILNEIRFKGIRIFLGLFCFLKSFSFSLSVSLIWALFRG